MGNKKVEQLYKVSSHCLDDHQVKQEELESVGRPGILSSVNNIARFGHKMDSGM